MKSPKLRFPVVVGLALMFGASLQAAEAASSAADVTAEARTSIEARFKKQDEQKAAAVKLRDEGRFDEAIRIFEQVLAELSLENDAAESRRVASRINEFKEELAKTKYLRGSKALADAKMAAADRKWSEARALAAGALEIPSLKGQAERLINYCIGMERQDEVNNELSVKTFSPDYVESRAKLSKLINEAKTFCRAKRYTEALNKIEEAYLIDPFDMDVIALSGLVYNELYTYGKRRQEADHESIVAFSKWMWAEPVFTEVKSEDNTVSGLVRDSGPQDAAERLNRIVFKRVDFEDADLPQVLRFLSERSSTFDPERKGVSINSSLTQRQMEDIQRLNLSYTNIPLDTLLGYICRMTGLKYRVDSDGSVFIGFEVNEMERKNFVVRGNLIKNIADEVSGGAAAPTEEAAAQDDTGMTEGEGGTSSKVGAGVSMSAASAKTKIQVSSAALMQYFKRRGVTFPAGSSISYNLGKREIVARNTAKNLQRIETLINQHNTDSKLIMVEIKAIEIQESDLQELGFHWSLGDGLYGVSENSAWVFGQGSNTASYSGSTASLQNVRPTFEAPSVEGSSGGFNGHSVDTTVVKDLNIFPALFGTQNPFGSDVPLNIGLTINALNRNTRNETLSAPKLITLDGKQAKIDVVRRYYFPESWDEIEVEVETSDNSSKVTITPPVPTFTDEGTPIGITFTVTPRVLEDNRTIQLVLNPKITSYLGKDEWPVNIYGYRWDTKETVVDQVVKTEIVQTPENYYFTIWRPITSRREMNVTLNVYDGETVVLGGIVESNNLGRTDKIPILGDLPLIGRFFQSQTDDITRTNLLIFVTARLMKNDGAAVNARQVSAEPDFNR